MQMPGRNPQDAQQEEQEPRRSPRSNSLKKKEMKFKTQLLGFIAAADRLIVNRVPGAERFGRSYDDGTKWLKQKRYYKLQWKLNEQPVS